MCDRRDHVEIPEACRDGEGRLDLDPGGVEAVSLYEAGKRIGLMERSKRNWADLLMSLCLRGKIEIRYEVDGIAAMRASDLPRLKELVDIHFAPRGSWPKRPKKKSSTRPYKG